MHWQCIWEEDVFVSWMASGVRERVFVYLQLSPKASTWARKGCGNLHSTKFLEWSADAFTQYEDFYHTIAAARDTKEGRIIKSLIFQKEQAGMPLKKKLQRANNVEKEGKHQSNWMKDVLLWLIYKHNTMKSQNCTKWFVLSFEWKQQGGLTTQITETFKKLRMRCRVQNCKVGECIPLSTCLNQSCL